MSKSKENKTNVLNNLGKTIVDLTNKYDVESKNFKKNFSAQDKYRMYKQVANNQEKKEFRDIERKYKKKSSIAQRTVPSEPVSDTRLPLNFFDYNFQKNFYKPDDTLKRIEKDRNKKDPDFFKGLGTFFQKKY